MAAASDALVNTEVARAIAPHTVDQARRAVILQAPIVAALVAAWGVLRFPLDLWFLPLFIVVGSFATIRDLRWYLRIRHADPVAVYQASQVRRSHDVAWLGTLTLGACIVSLLLTVILFVAGLVF